MHGLVDRCNRNTLFNLNKERDKRKEITENLESEKKGWMERHKRGRK